MTSAARMNEGQANQVWDLLVTKAGASESDRYAFVQYLTKPGGFHEYRFMGLLGFGGKFNYSPTQRGYLSCYSEDRDEVRDAIIETVNQDLAELLDTFRR